jgi:predicted O-linked N-acetylglucosamine transferase (SPINDLY family)
MSETLLQQARELHRAGKLREAIAAYRQLTDADPASAEYWRLRAMAEHQDAQVSEASGSIARAIDLQEADASAHLVAAHIAEDLRDYGAAEREFRRATELKPDWAAPWSGLGARLLEAGRPMEALDCFRRSIDLAPANARGWNNLGMAQLAAERPDDALRAFNQAVSLEPRYALAHFNLARVSDMRGDTQGAIHAATQAAQLDPRHGEARLLLGDLYRRLRDYAKSEQWYAAAANLDPNGARAQNALAELYWETGHDEQARALYQQVTARQPGNLKAALGSRLLLPAVYAGAAHLRESRERYARGLSDLLPRGAEFQYTTPTAALSDARWTNFYLAYQGGEDRELQRTYGQFIERVLAFAKPEWTQRPQATPRAGRRLRVGFASYFFYNCTAGRYFASWILGLDPARFETFVYYTNPWVADDTRAIAQAASTFRHLPGRALASIAEQVRGDALDILVYPELGMNAETFTMAALRLAPVQVAGWGHPTTTGLPSIDWFLSSAEMEPENAQAHYTEKLALLPGLGTRYARPSGEEEGTRADFGLPEGGRLYLVPQSLFKIHPDNDELIADVLARDPEGRVVMFAANHDNLTDRFVQRLAPVFAERGVDVSKRVLFLPYMTHGAYLRLNRLCDVMLDTVHWSGGNTSLDALAMGLPVVTLPGSLMRGRQSLGMLRMLGLADELVASDARDYVERAVAIASDPQRRAMLSGAILAGLDKLFDRPEPVAAFAEFLERVAPA